MHYHGRQQKIFQGGNVDILLIIFKLLTMQYKWTFMKRFTVSTSQRNYPCYGNNHKKCASLAAIPRPQVYCDNLHSRLSSGAASNFIREGPVTSVVRDQSSAILHKDHFDVTAQFLVYYNRIWRQTIFSNFLSRGGMASSASFWRRYWAICRFSKQDTSYQVNIARKEALSSTKPPTMTLFYLASKAEPSCYFRWGWQNVCSLGMLYLTLENVFENFGRGKIARLPSPWLRDLLARLVSVTLKELQM